MPRLYQAVAEATCTVEATQKNAKGNAKQIKETNRDKNPRR